ncbi:MAG: hypothetical protein ABFD04_13860 [Syntrophomonas sp.]
MVIFAYLGAVIGAGFASGQEVVQFFVSYGDGGLWGALAATLLFGMSGALLMHRTHYLKTSRYQALFSTIMGPRMSLIVDAGLGLFLFLGISTMFSASGAVFYEHLYLPKNLGIIAAYLVVAAFLLWGKRGLVFSYNILVPLKIILLLGVAGWVAFGPASPDVNSAVLYYVYPESRYWMVSCVLYVAYNFSLAMVVLTEYQSIANRLDSIKGAWWGGVILGMLVLLTYLALRKHLPVVLHYEVPMLYVAGQVSITAKHVYTLVLWMGIITTAIANTYGFAQRFTAFTGLNYRFCLILSMTMALPLSMKSFSQLVGYIYPLFGLLGVLILGALWLGAVKDMGRDLYYNVMKQIVGQGGKK